MAAAIQRINAERFTPSPPIAVERTRIIGIA
jgi:hypothetical protein